MKNFTFLRKLSLSLLLIVNVFSFIHAQSGTGDITAPSLNFQNPVFVSGSNNGNPNTGDVYKFSNVYAGVDALVRINSISSGETLENLDASYSTNGGYEAAFQPILEGENFNGGSASANFTFTFIKAGGTSSDLVRLNFYASPIDIDGDGGNGSSGIREYVEVDLPNTYIRNDPTRLTFLQTVTKLRGTAATTETDDGVSTNPRFAYSAYYEARSTLIIQIGTVGNNDFERLYSTYFQLIAFTDPVIDTNVPPVLSGNVSEQPGGAGIQGSTITITGPATQTTITDVYGNYSFTIPLNKLGNYTITQTNKPGYGNVSDVDGANDNIISNNIFGYQSIIARDFVDGHSDLAVKKTVDNPTANIGATVEFTIIAENNGLAAATLISVADALPSGFTFVSATVPSGTTYTGGVWSVGSLTSGTSKILKIKATVNAAGNYTNTAVISAASGIIDPVSNNNSSSATVCTPPSINTQPLITQAVCQNASPANLTVVATGTGLSYQWFTNATNSNTGGTSVSGATSASYTPLTTASGTKYYYVVVTGTCGTATSNVSAVIVTATNTAAAASSTPTLCIGTALTDITIATTGATGISNDGVSGANGLPADVSAAWASNTITISGTPTASGTFNYSIPLAGGCGTVNATGTITVTALPTIAVTSAASCSSNLLTYEVSVTVSAGTVTATPVVGTITNSGNVWTIEDVPAGTDITLKVEDGNTCSATVAVTAPICVPDYKPTIFPDNTNVIGTSGVIDFRVLIGEYLNINSDGITSVELRIFKNSALNISYNATLKTLNSSAVNNVDWAYDGSHPLFYKFTYIGNGGIFQANSAEFIGVNATYNPLTGSRGLFPLKTTIKYFSGGETRIDNNDDVDYIQYKNN